MPVAPMLDAARSLPRQVLDGLAAVDGVELPADTVDAVVLAGMGGSAIGGALSAALLDARSRVPLRVVRDGSLPGFVGQHTLVIATSYSGNTHETLELVRAAMDRDAPWVAVTTGGKLAELAGTAGAPLVRIPAGLRPRAAVGHLLAPNYAIAARATRAADPDDIGRAARSLESRAGKLAGDEGPAARLAASLGPGAVGIAGHDLLGVVARRWAGQIVENAKRVAFHFVLPEAMHNQVVGWSGQPGDASLVLLRRAREGAHEKVRCDHLVEGAHAAGARVEEVRLAGAPLDQALEGVFFGDLTSLHLCRLAGVDPEPVDVIDALKKKLDASRA